MDLGSLETRLLAIRPTIQQRTCIACWYVDIARLFRRLVKTDPLGTIFSGWVDWRGCHRYFEF